MYQFLYLPTYLSIFVCIHACMHVLYLSLFLVVCLSICSLSNAFSFLLQSVFSYLSVCLCWVVVHFELALNKWPEESVFIPIKGLQVTCCNTKIIQQILTKDGWLIWNQVDSCNSTYLSLALSFLLPTDTCLSILRSFYRPIYLLSTCTILPFLLSLYKSIYLYCLCILSICLSSYLSNLSI